MIDQKNSSYQAELNFIHDLVVLIFSLSYLNDDNCVSEILDPCPPFSQNDLKPHF